MTNVDIVEALKAQGVEVEKAMIRMPNGPLKQVGDHPVVGRAAHGRHGANITVTVIGDTARPEPRNAAVLAKKGAGNGPFCLMGSAGLAAR